MLPRSRARGATRLRRTPAGASAGAGKHTKGLVGLLIPSRGFMKIGVPKETAANERRVALTPDVAGRLVKAGLSVVVERGAGDAASFGDDAYGAAGATPVATAGDAFGQSDKIGRAHV